MTDPTAAAFDSHSREQLRRSYAQAWSKHLSGSPLTALEALITDVIGVHPEYREMVRDADAAVAFEPAAGESVENPFLHMGLHLAVREQLSIDRPPGIRELQQRLHAQCGDSHRVEHILMEALGETLWQAQRNGVPPDEARYIDLVRQRLRNGGKR